MPNVTHFRNNRLLVVFGMSGPFQLPERDQDCRVHGTSGRRHRDLSTLIAAGQTCADNGSRRRAWCIPGDVRFLRVVHVDEADSADQ